MAEAEWTRSLIGELSTGTFPMLDVWRQWQESGSIPTELNEIAQGGAGYEDLPTASR